MEALIDYGFAVVMSRSFAGKGDQFRIPKVVFKGIAALGIFDAWNLGRRRLFRNPEMKGFVDRYLSCKILSRHWSKCMREKSFSKNTVVHGLKLFPGQ